MIILYMCLIPQLCIPLCKPMDCSPLGSSVHWGFFRQEYWSGWPCSPLLYVYVYTYQMELGTQRMGFPNSTLSGKLDGLESKGRQERGFLAQE